MEKVARLKITPVILLVFLALLTLLVAKRHRERPVEDAEDDVVRAVVKVDDLVVHDEYAAVAFVALIALFALVIWTALGANKGEDMVTPPPNLTPEERAKLPAMVTDRATESAPSLATNATEATKPVAAASE
jgi:hypothetical protein